MDSYGNFLSDVEYQIRERNGTHEGYVLRNGAGHSDNGGGLDMIFSDSSVEIEYVFYDPLGNGLDYTCQVTVWDENDVVFIVLNNNGTYSLTTASKYYHY